MDKKLIVSHIPTFCNGDVGFFVYPIFFINTVIFIEENQDKYYELPVVNYDTYQNMYMDDNGNMFSNYFDINYSNEQTQFLQEIFRSDTQSEYHDRIIHIRDRTANAIYNGFVIDNIVMPYPTNVCKHKEYHPDNHKVCDTKVNAWFKKCRQQASRILSKYLKIKEHITQKADRLWNEMFSPDDYVIGCHIRGTDKMTVLGGRIITPDEYYPYIENLITKHPQAKIFIATDDPKMFKVFTNRYASCKYIDNILRSSINVFLDQDIKDNYKKGEDVLLDAICLSKCNFLLKCNSAVSEFAIYLNMDLHENSINLQYINT